VASPSTPQPYHLTVQDLWADLGINFFSTSFIMKKSIFIIALACACLVVSCTKDNPKTTSGNRVEITASMPTFTADTRTIISAGTGDNNASYHVYWYYGETLNVIRKSDYKICPFTNKVTTDPGTSGVQEATFVNDNVGDFFNNENETFVALFGVKLVTNDEGKATGFEMPTESVMKKTSGGNYIVDHVPMFGLTPAGGDNKSFQFHNACALLKVNWAGNFSRKVVVSTTTDNVALSGTIDITKSLASATTNPDKYIILADGGSKSVTVISSIKTEILYIPLPQCHVADLTITLYDDNGAQILQKTNYGTDNNGMDLVHGKIYEVNFNF